MTDGFEHWKSLQKQIEEVDRRVTSQAQELSRLRNLTQNTRDSVERLMTAMLGNETLGMAGLLDRLESLEQRLTKVWWAFLISLGMGAFLNIMTLYFLFRLLELR